MSEIDFHHITPIQLRFNDADLFGHVNNTVFFQYYDTAKIEYLRSIWNELGGRYALVVAHVDADFISPVYTTDHVAVRTAVTHIGNKSFTLQQELFDTDTKEVKCVGRTVMVGYDQQDKVAMPLLPEWVEAIENYEGKCLRS